MDRRSFLMGAATVSFGTVSFQSASAQSFPSNVIRIVVPNTASTPPDILARIVANALTETDLIQIVELMVAQLNTNLMQRAITITVTDQAKKWILEKTLVDRSYGARPLRRALQKYIEDPLSEALIQGTITTRPAFIEVYLDGDRLFYRPVGEEKAEGVLLYTN